MLGGSETELEDIVGISDGACEGGEVGMSLGTALGGLVLGGVVLGRSDGLILGRSDGLILGSSDGLILGRSDGLILGSSEGLGVGSPVEGASEGSTVGV
jgi:hypothetical protein